MIREATSPSDGAVRKVAVAIIHGMGHQSKDFSLAFQERLKQRLIQRLDKSGWGRREFPFEFVPVYWASIVDEMSEDLSSRLQIGQLRWQSLRKFIIGELGDAIAFQKPVVRNAFVYDLIHQRFKQCLKQAAQKCGPDAPLCVISHSLGTVIGSEVLKDLQEEAESKSSSTPLERGHTLALYFTMGSPLPIWSLRDNQFGSPPTVPAKQLAKYHPSLRGEWVNFYSLYDPLGFPLRGINEAFEREVERDVVVSPGNLLTRYTPLCHTGYWNSRGLLREIASMLVEAALVLNRSAKL